MLASKSSLDALVPIYLALIINGQHKDSLLVQHWSLLNKYIVQWQTYFFFDIILFPSKLYSIFFFSCTSFPRTALVATHSCVYCKFVLLAFLISKLLTSSFLGLTCRLSLLIDYFSFKLKYHKCSLINYGTIKY